MNVGIRITTADNRRLSVELDNEGFLVDFGTESYVRCADLVELASLVHEVQEMAHQAQMLFKRLYGAAEIAADCAAAQPTDAAPPAPVAPAPPPPAAAPAEANTRPAGRGQNMSEISRRNRATVAELSETGLTVREIAERLSLSQSAVYEHRRALGLHASKQEATDVPAATFRGNGNGS